MLFFMSIGEEIAIISNPINFCLSLTRFISLVFLGECVCVLAMTRGDIECSIGNDLSWFQWQDVQFREFVTHTCVSSLVSFQMRTFGINFFTSWKLTLVNSPSRVGWMILLSLRLFGRGRCYLNYARNYSRLEFLINFFQLSNFTCLIYTSTFSRRHGCCRCDCRRLLEVGIGCGAHLKNFGDAKGIFGIW